MLEKEELWQYPDVGGVGIVSAVHVAPSFFSTASLLSTCTYTVATLIFPRTALAPPSSPPLTPNLLQLDISVQEPSKKRKLEETASGNGAGAGASGAKDLLKSDATCECNQEIIKQQVSIRIKGPDEKVVLRRQGKCNHFLDGP